MNKLEHIRNFAIIAHVDHGKSTLADRLIELTKTVPTRSMRDQILDTLELEREKGITIKLQPVCMEYVSNSKKYILNLIDTPGHVDFSYEVNRTLAAVEGALLLVDASQGVEAQTLAHLELARQRKLKIIPVINKIDLPNADIERVSQEIEKLLGCKSDEIIKISAKKGTNIQAVLAAIIARIPAPHGDQNAPARALVFDSIYDTYRGVIAYVRVFDGQFKKEDQIILSASKAQAKSGAVGIFKPQRKAIDLLSAGLTGYIETGLKKISLVRVGDTITQAQNQAEPLAGYEPSTPKVYAALFPADPDQHDLLREALERLALNDAALKYEQVRSQALGAGFKAGFLGLLHLEIVQERIKREFNVEIISTTPCVVYHLVSGKQTKIIRGPAELPKDLTHQDILQEPWSQVEIVTPTQYIGSILLLVANRRGKIIGQDYLDPTRVIVKADMPLAEVIIGFYDRIKSVSKGYASLNYKLTEYQAGDLVKMDVLLAEEPVEALAMIVPRNKASNIAHVLTRKLKELIPPQQYAVPIQVAIGGKIISRETLSARRKDVIAKLYGGDVTRKRKLLEKQKKGKKRLKEKGRINLPSSAYLKLMKTDFYER